MELSLLHAGLAAGAGLATIPVIIHLLMRQQPKHVIFPALRLIRDRQKQSRKKLRIKNWLLLLLRMLILAAMAFALARPTLTTESSIGDFEVDTAIALIFDTSLSMQYADRGADRLKEAKQRAVEIARKATDKSEFFIIDSAEPVRPAPLSRSNAERRIDALELRPAVRPLNASILQALAAVSPSALPRREIYVLTDMVRSAWETGSNAIGEEFSKLEAKKIKVALYIVSLAPKEVADVGVVDVEIPSPLLVTGESVEIRGRIRATGPKVSRVAEFWLDGAKRDQKPVEIEENGETSVSFLSRNNLEPGLHQGEIRLGGGADFLPFDDARYFTIDVRPPTSVILVADSDIDAVFVRNALVPDASTLPVGTPQLFQLRRIGSADLASLPRETLDSAACVFLLNPGRVSDSDWSRLSTYVRQGGGLVVGLGDRAVAESYNQGIAAQLLPARLVAPKRLDKTTFFDRIEDPSHPLFNRHAQELTSELNSCAVLRYWDVEAPEGQGRRLLSFADGSPALLERVFKGTRTGHVLLWTTPLSRRPDRDGGLDWNTLPNSWAFVELLLKSVIHLGGASGERRTIEAGEDALLAIDPSKGVGNFTLTDPDRKPLDRIAPAANSETLVVNAPRRLGNWTVEGQSPKGETVKLGFSVNPPASECDLGPLGEKALESILGGEKNYFLAGDSEGLKKIQQISRVGFELFPWIMFLVMLVVTVENLLANRFHRERQAA